MKTKTLLPEPGKYYHIFNRGINSTDIFRENSNYEYFLKKYDSYISSVAKTYAWCLLRNHFHLLVGIPRDLPGFRNLEGLQQGRNPVSQAFSNLFNAYTKAFNKKYKRTGSLFEKNFHRLEVNNSRYFQNLVVYIHKNPVHHRFTDDFKDYPWSSYGSVISMKPTKLERDKVIGWFNGKGDFVGAHNKKVDYEIIKDLIIE